jgi:hypothetical protein
MSGNRGSERSLEHRFRAIALGGERTQTLGELRSARLLDCDV